MTKRVKIWLIALLSALCMLFGVAGCSIGKETLDEVLEGFGAHVTYYGNGGLFDGSNTVGVRSLYFRNDPESENYSSAGVPFFDVTQDTQGIKVNLSGYELVGWFLPETYADGEHKGEPMYTYTPEGSSEAVPVYPVYDENGEAVTDDSNRRPVFAREGVDEEILESNIRVVASDTQLTSDYIVAHDADIIVCAKWVRSLQIEYVLVFDEGQTLTDADGNTYKNGDIIREDAFGNSATSSPTTREPVSFSGATFLRTYADEECTVQAGIFDRPTDGQNVRVYSKYIAGDWTVVSKDDVNSVASMFNGLRNEDNKYYVLDSIDCKDVRTTINLRNSTPTFSVKATVQGNGHTISNLKFTASVTRNLTYSIFGNIAESANITGLTLDGINIEFTSRYSEISMFAICDEIADGATMDLTIGNITAVIKAPDKQINNAQLVGGVLDTSHWLCGGTTNDEEFISLYGDKITVTGTNTLTIN